MGFPETLKYLRNSEQFTQKNLAKKLNLTANTVCEWEKGRSEPSITTIKKLAELFNVTTDYLLGLEDDFGNVIIEKEAPQLSAEELQIIENYRALNPSGKKLVKQTIDTLNSSSSSSSAKKYS